MKEEPPEEKYRAEACDTQRVALWIGDQVLGSQRTQLIAYTCAGARILHLLLTRGITRSTQAWRTR